MKRFVKILALSLLLTCNTSSIAGSPDGLQLLVVGTAAATAHQPRIAQYFKEYEAAPTSFDCDDNQLNIGAVFQAPLKAITPELAQKALSNPVQRKTMGKVMEKYRSKDYERGFDGALFYDLQDGKLMLYGISAWSKEKILASSIPASDIGNRSKFNLAMCRALLMPVLQAP